MMIVMNMWKLRPAKAITESKLSHLLCIFSS